MSGATDTSARVRLGYERAIAGFNEAAQRSAAPVESRRFQLGRREASVRIVGGALARQFSAPWQHLGITTAIDPHPLSIDVWHRAETGVSLDVADTIDPASRFPYEVSDDSKVFALRQPQTRAWLDRERGHLVAVIDDVERRALYEAGRPLEMAVLVWLRDQRTPLVHAACVAGKQHGVLILGRSGSGKSTLAGECASRGFGFLGDDKVALTQQASGGFIAHSLSSSLHLDAGSLARIGDLGRHAIAPGDGDDKFRVPLESAAPSCLRGSATISAIVIPSLTAPALGAPAIRPASRKEALLALSLSTLLALPIERRLSLDAFAALAETVPAFSFSLLDAADAPGQLAMHLDAMPM